MNDVGGMNTSSGDGEAARDAVALGGRCSSLGSRLLRLVVE